MAEKVWLVFSVLWSLHPVPCAADSGRDGFKFLDIPLSARTAAMGGAVSAVSDDASGALWNPALIAGLHRAEADLFRMNYFEGMSANQILVARPVGRGGLLAQVQTFDYGSFDAYDRNGVRLGRQRASDLAGGIATGRTLGTHWALGGGIKSVGESVGDVKYQTWAADGGLLYSPEGGEWWKRLRWGAALRNAGPSATVIQGKTTLPQSWDVGASYRTFSEAWLVAVDVASPRDGSRRVRLGQELWVHPVLAIRAGYAGGQNGLASAVSAGVGVRFHDLRVDYSFTAGKNDFEAVHRFGLSFRFGGATESLYQEGVRLLQSGGYAEAILKFKKVLDANPSEGRAVARIKEAVQLLKKERGEEGP